MLTKSKLEFAKNRKFVIKKRALKTFVLQCTVVKIVAVLFTNLQF